MNRPKMIEAWYISFVERKVMASKEARRRYSRLMTSEEKHYCSYYKKNMPIVDATYYPISIVHVKKVL